MLFRSECFAQYLPGFADGHVFFAQVHPVHFQLFGQLYVVVENQDRFFSSTERFQLQCHCLHLFRRCLFHAQLDPFTAPFKIGSARLDDYGKVNIELAAKILKANPDKKYKVAGYADKATGSASWNQKLSEKRAQVVYDALIAQGVDKDQLELVGFGGTANMFGKNFLNRVVILE